MSVLIYTENWDGKFKKLSFELVSYGKKIAEMLGSSAIALSIGNVSEDELKKLGNYGADKIINASKAELKDIDSMAYASVIEQIAKKIDAKVIVIANNNTGKAVAPRLSVKLKAGIGSGVTKLPVSVNPFVVYKKVFSGKAFAQVAIKSDIKIITLAQNSFELIPTENKASIENIAPEIDNSIIKTKVQDVQKVTGQILLTDAEIVVSGGRGMKSPDNWKPIE
ncbi:MAG: electron transfer flavoprotein subunit alpha/FixB family protein, partial [Bacteroidales bacterium]|nr:electron transfer flavoprotein subunit alpha/FixB family protein [Bacteroidales bacterium]